MSDELRAAAERLRAEDYTGTPVIFKMPQRKANDARQIVNAYLAEHPADDDVPVTEEWLNSLGRLWIWKQTLDVVWKYGRVGFRIGVTFKPQPQLKTRGDIRRLFNSLSKPIKETTE